MKRLEKRREQRKTSKVIKDGHMVSDGAQQAVPVVVRSEEDVPCLDGATLAYHHKTCKNVICIVRVFLVVLEVGVI